MSWYSLRKYSEAYLSSPRAKPNVFLKWAEAKGVTKYAYGYIRGTDWAQMIRTGRDNFPNVKSPPHHDNPPYLDHQIVFKNPVTKQCWLTYQPYQRKEEIEADVAMWAKAHNLHATVYDSSLSWHNDYTCLVVIEAQENENG